MSTPGRRHRIWRTSPGPTALTGRAPMQSRIQNRGRRLTYPHFSSNKLTQRQAVSSEAVRHHPVCSRSSHFSQDPHLQVTILPPCPTSYFLARNSHLDYGKSLLSPSRILPSFCFLNKALLNFTHLQFTALGITQIAHQSSL